jgi:hypothetical protein
MGGFGWLAMVGLLGFSLAQAAQTGGTGPVTLDGLMAVLRSVPHVQARYIEHRTFHALRTPVETRGTLRFDAPGYLDKQADPGAKGAGEHLTIDGDRLTIDPGAAGGGRVIALSLQAHPEVGVLVDSLRATLSGDGAALRRIFEVTVSGTLEQWQLVLQPRDAAQRDLLRVMRISGYGERITAIETEDNEGDRSEMSIVELRR